MDVSPAATPPAAAPGPDPITADRIAALEQKLLRMRRDMDRMARVMALLEHDRAIERVLGARPTLLDRIGAWIAQAVGWLSPWAPRTGPRTQRPLA